MLEILSHLSITINAGNTKFTTIQGHILENVRKLFYYIRITESSVEVFMFYTNKLQCQ